MTDSLSRAEATSVLEPEMARNLRTMAGSPDDDGAPWPRVPSLSRILLPFGGFWSSEAALAATVRLCETIDARVRVVHLREWDQCRGARFFLESPAEADELVQSAADRLRIHGVCTDASVRDVQRARVAQAILSESSAFAAHLIVLGARPRRLAAALIAGSTSHEVMRGAQCPVLLVHPPTGDRWSLARAFSRAH